MHAITEGVWRVEGPDFRLPGGAYLPTSATVLRLADRTLLVYSPVDFTDDQAAAIAAAGEVAHVVAPNLFHHVFLSRAKQRWPRATLHAPPGLAAKVPDLGAHRSLADAPDPAWADLELEVIAGAPKIDEAVLFHRPSGTLVCADLFFHVTQPRNLRTRMILGMMGTGGRRFAQSRLWNRLIKDRPAAGRSAERILAWPVRHVTVAHGEPIELPAPADLAAAMTRFPAAS